MDNTTQPAFDPMNPLASIHSMLLPQLESARTTQQGALEKLRAAHAGELPVEAKDEGSRWGAIAAGLARPSASVWQAIAQAGGDYGKELQRQFNEQRINQQKGADLEFQDASRRLTALESKYASALTGMGKPGAQGRWVSRQIPGTGEVMLFNSLTGQERPLSSNDSVLLKSMEDRYLKVADKAGYVGTEAVQWAKEMAAAEIANKPQTTSYQPAGAEQPMLQTTKPFAPVQQPPEPVPMAGAPTKAPLVAPKLDRTAALQQLRLEQKKAESEQDYNKATEIANAIAAMQTAKTATPEEEARIMGTAPAAPSAAPAPERRPEPEVTNIQRVPTSLGDVRPDVKRKEAYAGEQGKDLALERKSLAAAERASSTMEGQLLTLKKLYESNADITQGEGAGAVKAAKSYLKTFGVDVGPSAGLEDIIQATASNMALHMRTADGENLLPGAMSNYEDKMLQGMAPGLSMTAEGRKAMIDFMLEITRANQRIAKEATAYEMKNKQLDAGWYARRERVMKEEKARLAQRRNEIMAQFGSK